ncbi:MAG: response regulator [Anaerolineaceae bacterium]|nr:response regulator [Anaerolineaceae bacterium]
MPDSANRTIVYIEDEPEMIDLVTVILNRHGFTVKGAHGGRQGLDLIHSETPDIILLDLMMPDLDGWDVFQQVKNDEITRNIPVIVITAKSQTIDKVLGLHIARVDDYICKPFHPQDLIDSLNRVLAPRSSKPG